MGTWHVAVHLLRTQKTAEKLNDVNSAMKTIPPEENANLILSNTFE